MTTITQDTRQKLADKSQAMPDGSFPIRNQKDLANAIKTFGLAKNKVSAKAWIIKRAQELSLTSMLPSGWNSSDKSMAHSEDELFDTDEHLAHFGILGMKWGHRNPDSQREEAMDPHVDHVQAHALNKKPIKSLSNKDLQTVNQRLQLEQQYSKLKSNTGSLKKIKKGDETVKTVIGVIGTATAAAGLTMKFVKSEQGQRTIAAGARFVGKVIGKT